MGFKEVMALRKEGNLEKALEIANKDFEEAKNQWSASALFWVLRDLSMQNISGEDPEMVDQYLRKMQELIPMMGATATMAEQALLDLQNNMVPHLREVQLALEDIVSEKNIYKHRAKVLHLYTQMLGWCKDFEGIEYPLALQDPFVQVMKLKLNVRAHQLALPEFIELTDLYFKFQIAKPSAFHFFILEKALELKIKHDEQFDFAAFLEEWNPIYLTLNIQDNEATYKKNLQLAEITVYAIVKEVLHKRGGVLPEYVEVLLDFLETSGISSSRIALTKVRRLMIQGAYSDAEKEYKRLFVDVVNDASIWYEYSTLEVDEELKLALLAKTLKEESNEYSLYLNDVRLDFVDLLIKNKWYERALRELAIIAQVTQERGRTLPERYYEYTSMIPEGTIQDKDNKSFYVQISLGADDFLYGSIEPVVMAVMDVVAMNTKKHIRQVVPMLKLRATDGRVVMVNPKEFALPTGDHRGACMDVRFIEHKKGDKKYVRVLSVRFSKTNIREVFPISVGYISGYYAEMHAFHVLDTNSVHHYLPGDESMYPIGAFISFILLKDVQNNQTTTQGGKSSVNYRYILIAPELMDPLDAIPQYPTIKAVVARVIDDVVYVVTDDSIQGQFNTNIIPIDLSPGDTLLLSGFVFKKKDRVTGDVQKSFVTFSAEFIPSDLF